MKTLILIFLFAISLNAQSLFLLFDDGSIDVTENMTHYYTMDEDDLVTVTMADQVGSNDLTYVNTPTFDTDAGGDANGATIFDGVEENAVFGSNLTMAAPFSLSIWMRIDAIQSTSPIGGGDAGNQMWARWLTTDLVIARDGANSSQVDIQAFDDSTWHHFVLVHTGTDFLIYIDNVSRTVTDAGDAPASDDTGYLKKLAIRWATDDFYFNGGMHDIRVYSVAISEDVINSLYTNNN